MYNFHFNSCDADIFFKDMHRFKRDIQKKLQNCLRMYVNSFNSMVLITDVHTGFTLQLPQLTNFPLSLS